MSGAEKHGESFSVLLFSDLSKERPVEAGRDKPFCLPFVALNYYLFALLGSTSQHKGFLEGATSEWRR